MQVAFRVDSSGTIGSGHVIRCLTLAESLREHGVGCLFVCRKFKGNISRRIEEAGFEVRYLEFKNTIRVIDSVTDTSADFCNWLGSTIDEDISQTKAAIGDQVFDWFIVDNYGIDHHWETAMRSHCKRIMVIDDLANRSHDCDLLLDQNLVEGYESRYKPLVPRHCQVLVGPEFAILQPQYSELHSRIPPRRGPIRGILVSFGGGAASLGLTEMTVDAFNELNLSDVRLDVVISGECDPNNIIRSKAFNKQNISVYDTLPSLCELMAMADLSVGASGATTWERCCLGLPAVVVTLTPNQIPLATELNRLGAIDWIGHRDSVTVAKLSQAIRQSLQNPSQNELRSFVSYGLVKGSGLQRVTQYLTVNSSTELTIRRVKLDDEALLLVWANDPAVRENSFNSGDILPDTHRDWFYKRLRNLEGCCFYLVCASGGLPIGQVRFERQSQEWEVHYSLSPSARGRGLGVRVLDLAISEFRKTQPEVMIHGRVKRDNIQSCRIFEKLGFSRDFTPDGNVLYFSGK